MKLTNPVAAFPSLFIYLLSPSPHLFRLYVWTFPTASFVSAEP